MNMSSSKSKAHLVHSTGLRAGLTVRGDLAASDFCEWLLPAWDRLDRETESGVVVLSIGAWKRCRTLRVKRHGIKVLRPPLKGQILLALKYLS